MLKSSFSLPDAVLPHVRENGITFNFPWFALFTALVILPFTAYGQGSMQRLVRISGDNGNIVSLSAGAPAATYTLTLPPNINPSTTAASVLFGTGSGLLDWTPAASSDSGFVIQLIDVGGGQLKPRWVSAGSFSVTGNFWSLDGNSLSAAWNGTTGSFVGTTNSTPLILATTNTTTAQPIEFFTNNTERMRLAPTGELGIGVTPASGVLLHVGGTAGTSNVRFNSLSGANLPLVFGANEGLLIADANGNLSKRDPSVLQQNYVQYNVATEQGQSVTRANNLFNIGYSASADDANAAGALITSTGGATNRNATALTLAATATGVGTATGLSVTALGGAANNAIDATGNIRLLSSGGIASRLSLQNPAGTFATTFSAGAQTANINYTLPTALPAISGQVLTGTTSGDLAWVTVGGTGTLTGSGEATRIAIWGPGPGATTNLIDDANLYWDNTNDRLSLGSGTTPSTPLHVTLNDAGTSTTANVVTLDHTTSGTPAAGFGEALNFRLQTGSGGTAQTRDAAKIGAVWSTPSDTYRTGDITFSTVDSGTTSEKMRITGEGYIGIGNTNPNYSVDMTGAYGTRATTITCSSASQNNDVYIGNSSYVRIVGPTGPFTMSGMGQGYDGKRVRVANLTGQDWTILDSSSASSAGNRFVTGTNSDVTIKGPVSVLDFIYDGPTNQWFLGTLNANQIIGSVGSLVYRYKTADESVTNSSVIQDDDHLYFYVNGGESWEINGEIDVSNPANNYDIKCAFEIPTSSAMKIMFTGIQDAGGNAIQGNGQFTSSNQTKLLKINFGVHTLITFRGIVRAVTSGYIKFRWAQDVANLTNPTTVHAYSYLKITRVN